MATYGVATMNHSGHQITYAIAMSYQDEVELLEGLGVTVLPGPEVFVPPQMCMVWLPGTDVCCVGTPDGSYTVHPQHQPCFVKTHHTWALW